MHLVQIIYASRPFGFDQETLNGILSQSRRCNLRDDITGALICRSDLYLQLLEGPEDAITATYARIIRDDRHLEVNRLSYETVTERLFPGWAMRDDPARSWMWTQAEVAKGAIAEATPQEVLAIFKRIAAEPV
ncbi:BLUF domain-containing protein [Methylobacterium sp. BTF04]|uniref:BLUF domain-containing protein n=1 Tax=Methylobacterium sp. BTF04 TaxID=2708300 RepID=UPI0013D6B3D0|nr:BLUF domain-containing protein [Methylobacterium sp. BTF04]NEU12139.1 BLUF domain-containing protein [Methylobacterium sp. BTF04]